MINFIVNKLLLSLPPETAHQVALTLLRLTYRIRTPKKIISPCTLMGIEFPNPVGLAAGMDKNGDYIDALASLGFGFIEIGTVTPRPQRGNPKPRLFRLAKEQAIINRMGFNNKGVDYCVEKIRKAKFKGVLGVNIGKNADTPLESATDDYLTCFRRVAPFASYVTLNISSPNTASLRNLQHGKLLTHLLRILKQEQAIQKKYVPLVVKISPDLTRDEFREMADIFLMEKIDGVIATNTTLNRSEVDQSIYANESGGLSGRPLRARSTQIIKLLHELLQEKIPLIGCGGIFSREDVEEKMRVGASLVQVYSGLVFQDPKKIMGIR